MKKTIYFTMMVMLSVMVLGSSAAEEKVNLDNRVASINEESVKQNNQSVVESGGNVQKFSINEETLGLFDGDLLVDAAVCADWCWNIFASLCAVSPSNPKGVLPGLFGSGEPCELCAVTCTP